MGQAAQATKPAWQRRPHRMETVQVGKAEGRWGIAEETPIEIGFNGHAWAVMMATPQDLEDLALGLAFTEGVLSDPACAEEVLVRSLPEGITADVRVAREHLNEAALRRRALDGMTGCGLCGVERLAEALHRPGATSFANRPAIDVTAIERAFRALRDHQPLNRATRSVHAAAWADLDGGLVTAREDVGRHNALDKLIGALYRGGGMQPEGFVVMSSRCSFELVSKTARTPAGALATVSAPTGYALDLGRAVGLSIATLGPGDVVVRFDGEASHER